ncbi:MAG: copper resistance system multicopper oxidase [Chromatiales bacterium]|nr:copper resistance system multicopper oxidase [Chromatiales bacterium]
MNRYRHDAGRRRVLKGLAASGIAGGLGLWQDPLWARAQTGRIIPLTGPDFDLIIDEAPVSITGRRRTAVLVNGSLPAPLLHWREGDTVSLRVTNRLAEPTSIHWHGLILPANMDGVPGLSFDGIAPGETFTYRFPLEQAGTYWYHSHSGFQEQLGHYGPLVIQPREPDPWTYDRDYVVMLSDWTDENPVRVLAKLKKYAEYYNFNERTVMHLLRDFRDQGFRQTLAERAMWGRMRMSEADLADISGYTYTFLVNGAAPADNWTGLFDPGDRIRLRFINSSAMSYFDVRIPGLKMTVVAADGLNVKPVSVDEFRISTAETFDVLVEPEDRAYTIFAQPMDRTGYARGTLAPRPGMSAPVPEPDPPVFLTMADMGHGDHAGHGDRAQHDHHRHHGDHAHHGHAQSRAIPVLPEGVRHHPAEFGPGVDMRVDTPSIALDDPGVGLRDNGRRVLTYADLESDFPDPDGREPARTIELHLTGHMERYIWSFNGRKASQAEPIFLSYGERVRIVFVNDTMMAHPIHLHGMWSDLEDEQGQFRVRKHTINVPPGSLRSIRVTADALGRWALHCHLLMHMETGMFRTVIVDEGPLPEGAVKPEPQHGPHPRHHGGHHHG